MGGFFAVKRKWTGIVCSISRNGGAVKPKPRSGHSVAVIKPGKLVFFGGMSKGDYLEILDELLMLDTVLGTWSRPATAGTLPDGIPAARLDHAVCVFETEWEQLSCTRMLMFGGADTKGITNQLVALNLE
ncbi:hypothetical protein HK101_000207 [Irineochytrium annulatum]|nr:hypothetical protein HK101_000207 [Irineochytrium annulatum]